MVRGVGRGRQPLAEPSDQPGRGEDQAVKGDWGGSLARGPPVDELSLCYQKGDVHMRGPLRDGMVEALKAADISSVCR